jgi:hypothetical protein
MNIEYEEKYLDGTIIIPSIDIFMYEYISDKQSFEYNKIFGIGHTISLPKKDIEPIKNISYNNIKVKIPTNPKNILNIIYPNNNLDLIVITRKSYGTPFAEIIEPL